MHGSMEESDVQAWTGGMWALRGQPSARLAAKIETRSRGLNRILEFSNLDLAMFPRVVDRIRRVEEHELLDRPPVC